MKISNYIKSLRLEKVKTELEIQKMQIELNHQIKMAEVNHGFAMQIEQAKIQKDKDKEDMIEQRKDQRTRISEDGRGIANIEKEKRKYEKYKP